MDSKEASYTQIGGHKSHLWVFSSVIALFCFTFGGIIIAEISQYPFSLKVCASISYLVFSAIVSFYYLIAHIATAKQCPQLYALPLFLNRKLAPGVIIGFLGGIINAGGQLSYLLAWYFDERGRGIIVSLLAASTAVSALGAYIIYGEKLKNCEIIGVLVTTGGILGICLESSFDGTLIAYVGGVLCLFLFGVRNLIGRQMQVDGLDTVTAGIVNSIGDGVSGAVLAGVLVSLDEVVFDEDFNLWQGFAGCMIITIGAFFTNQAVMSGKIGVSLTVVNLQGALFIVLEFVLFGVEPTLVKLVGAMIVILGIVVLLLGDSIFFKVKDK